MNKPIIEFQGVTVGYSNRLAFYDITLKIEKGEYIGIIGPNGSGKSTMLKTILGLIKPIEGRISVFGMDTNGACKFRSRIGYLPQKEAIDPRFPILVKEVVLMGRYSSIGFFNSPSKKDKDIAFKALSQVDMEDFVDEAMGHLSGGQQQRVLIARALAQEPDILLMDEPTAGVDVETQEKILDITCKIHKDEGLTILMVTHDINQIFPYVNRVAYLNTKLYAIGEPKEALNWPPLARVLYR